MHAVGNAGEAALTNIDRLSTAGVAAPKRFAHWQDIFADIDRSMALEGEPEAFQGALTRLIAGDLQIMSVKSSPLVSRSGDRTATEETCFSLQLVHSGRCQLRHAGMETVAETGDMVVVDARRPYELTFKRPLDGLVLFLPWARVGHHAQTLEKLAGRRMINAGPAAVLSCFIRSAWDNLVEREDEEWPQSATDVIWDLLASVLQDDRVADARGSRADELRSKARTLVDHLLFDPEFRSSVIAEELGVSARYLQQVFAETGTTPARYLLARRLDAAALRLRHADKPCRVTDVALECGFSDLSYFSRAFRRRFGVSARGYQLGQGLSADWT